MGHGMRDRGAVELVTIRRIQRGVIIGQQQVAASQDRPERRGMQFGLAPWLDMHVPAAQSFQQ